MRILLLVILAIILSASVAFADALYLKDGSIVRGTITSEDDKTVFIEMTDTWRLIDKSTIERIMRDEKPSHPGMPPSGVQPMPPAENIVLPPPPPPPPYLYQHHPAYMQTTNVDVRVKFGSAAGADTLEMAHMADLSSDTDRKGGNVQVEVVMSPLQGSMVGPVFSVGAFGRQHSGKIIEATRTTTMEYNASGVSFAGGVRLKASERFHFEIKVEAGLGSGEVNLDSPTYIWNKTRSDSYSSIGLIAGWYYAFSKPGLQLGLEIGAQSFTGDFEFWNTTSGPGHWDAGKVTGSGGTANLTLGFHF